MTVPPLDTLEFTRRGATVSGTIPLVDMERLGPMLLAGEGELAWSLSGRSELGPDGSRRGFMRLVFGARPTLRCVRCLEPIEVEIAASLDYRMVGTEAQAEREDADEDDHDLLVSSRQFDLAGLIEDEAIMALPLAPRHPDCRAPGIAGSVELAASPPESAERRAFAALQSLRAAGEPDADSGGG